MGWSIFKILFNITRKINTVNIFSSAIVTVTLKKSQWFGTKWIAFFKGKPVHLDLPVFRFYISGRPDEITRELTFILNFDQIETLNVNYG